ncbi:hypothetical protein [Nitrobacter sp.]|uniref:hypothetical protein n=1 Tax=Nitrobacter sp. TaxID=29420 RepID=UPI003F64C07E
MGLAPYGREEINEWVLAADIGQSNDPTAICVMQHQIVQHRNIDEITRISEHFDVRYLQRLPLGMNYVDQVVEVRRLLARPPLCDGCSFVIDNTGVGRAVGDLFDEAGMLPTKVSITAGNEQTRIDHQHWHVPKGILISTLDARLHLGELRIAADLMEAGPLKDEMKDFQRKVSAAGRTQWEARVGKHDDLVLAVALALWSFVGQPKFEIVTAPLDFY